VKCWGWNLHGQLGDGTKGDGENLRLSPVDVVGLDGPVVQITAGDATTCAVLSSGAVQCWGGFTGDLEPATVGELNGVVQAWFGDLHSCFVLETGGVKCWGFNESGQIGDDSLVAQGLPVDVKSLSTGVSQVQVGQNHSCALMSDGHLNCWGKNDLGQVGNAVPTGAGGDALSKIPVPVSGFP
jgi:alpha-tubulin suppressor-like RCC1 family protein